MKLFLAYALVIVLGHWCLTFGMLIVGFLIALCLAWMPAHIRVPIAGTLAGIAGIATAVAFGYFAFRFIVGPTAYGIGAFLASTAPLVVSIARDRKHALQLADAAQKLPQEVREISDPNVNTVRYSVFGYKVGLVLAGVWYFFFHANVA